MMLKKQTVWLLTMLSLMIVLSVYYMTSPPEGELAYMGDEENADQQTAGTPSEGDATTQEGEDGSLTSSLSSDQYFSSMQLDIMDSRSKKIEELENIMASSEVSAEEVNDAKNEIDKIRELSTKESVAQQSIQAKAEYPDVFVRAEDDKVLVKVKANEMSKQDVSQIHQIVYDEFGPVPVVVEYIPNEK
ncbi:MULTISPECIES: SpoIIIAH-like family protein [Pontibacillus]|uniref:SpoIIIAH-like family protein n=1 Tax=Pontibacillus chungwhensis TaxID=265426 RepID=A0ABY8UT87_9BACI|nr:MULTISPECIES: SpoIIIAH-like family protein [Pontibacillus]MCD5323520.1 SpoIIIAH-like family protein [Pontibacillus sp. HN14]WIF96891.1 SpoIIIAH-like family protein [Pontibacillus chungwhensis]